MAVREKWFDGNLVTLLNDGAQEGLEKLGKEMVEEIKNSMENTSGRPGAPPRVQSKILRDSIKSHVYRAVKYVRLQLGSDCVYARVQEWGGGPKKLPPRPFIRPVLERHKYHIVRDVGNVMRMKLRMGLPKA